MGTVGRSWSRKVLNCETGEVYSNVRAAAKVLGVHHSTVYERLNGNNHKEYMKTFSVMWVDE